MIRFEHVSKRYDDGTLAVDDLSLECNDAEITVLVGSSGCGKTTSLRMVNRMVEPSSGTVTLDGVDVRSGDPAELRRRMGYVIQQGGLFPHRTVEDNIATVPRLLGSAKRPARRRAHELMALVGLQPELARRYPHQLSGGQQQRVGVARALAADPPVLLMDEPFSAVDPIVRAELQQELLRLQEQLSKTIVFVTHDIDEAVKIGDKIAVMRVGGKLVQSGRPQEVLAEPADPFVESFLGRDRGIRWLSFFPAADVPLHPAPTVTPDATGEAGGRDGRWVIAVDPSGLPLGWIDRSDPGGPQTGAGLGLRPLGRTFNPESDSLRSALDAVVLSPAALAVAVDGKGRLLGVAGPDDVTDAIGRASGRP